MHAMSCYETTRDAMFLDQDGKPPAPPIAEIERRQDPGAAAPPHPTQDRAERGACADAVSDNHWMSGVGAWVSEWVHE